MPNVTPVVLSGGSGTRLFPLSTDSLPKQFADLLPSGSLFALTLERIDRLPGVRPTMIVTGAAHRALVEETSADAARPRGLLVVEPEGRNTAAAVVTASLIADPDEILLILPSDHLIADAGRFAEAVEDAATLAETGVIVTLGVVPSRPETGYGYIETDDVARSGPVLSFREKPTPADAAEFASDGRHLWNSGMFVFPASLMIEEAGVHCPDVLSACRRAVRAPEDGVVLLGSEFLSAPSVPIDKAVMEKTVRAMVVPLRAGWDDLGSYQALWEASDHDADGNAVTGDVRLYDVHGSLIRAAGRRVAVVGIDDVVVIETPEVVLVTTRDKSQLVREVSQGDG